MDTRTNDITGMKEALTTNQPITPISCRPWTLNALSRELIVSHYENHYGAAVQTVNAVRGELASLDADAPAYQIRALKVEELTAMGSVALHELYFGNLGGDGKIPDAARIMLEAHFGTRPPRLAVPVGTGRIVDQGRLDHAFDDIAIRGVVGGGS